MRVHIIGCAGSFAGTASAASSYLVEHEDPDRRTWRVLIDLGSGAFGPLQSVIDPATLDALVISHLHPDHFLDITGLEVFWAYNERRDLGRLAVHAPSALPARIRAVMSAHAEPGPNATGWRVPALNGVASSAIDWTCASSISCPTVRGSARGAE